MEIGVISDVHANAVALEAVLSDMPAVEAVVCVGDVVGYGPHPRACVERVRETAAHVVQGNHDRSVATPAAYRHNEMAYEGLRYARERLDDDQRAWLAALPEGATCCDGRVRLVHDHPTERDRYVYPDEFGALSPHLGDERALLLGHTHVQHDEYVDGTLVVNPGSVGQPRDGDPRAAYAVLDVDGPSVEQRRVPYDVERVRAAVETAGLPERTGARLALGK
ncbi:metallophosphoesterase family protein [Halomarina pelagica]|uniref:metallophosphoesterase family protein n=1 Tax=Halomarina pelagica TaxID=2961599 RepID=UPI0020C4E5C6|nr:metallophosphoesterase family protein [Halomarina sp. BND7]